MSEANFSKSTATSKFHAGVEAHSVDEKGTVGYAAFEANLGAVKGSIGCDRVAETEVELKQSGRHLRGRCPLPGHDGDSPSFYCYDNGGGFYDKWYCQRCSRGGDVLDLHGAMYGLDHNLRYCLEDLADRHGVRLWRPEDFQSDAQMQIRRARIRAERLLAQGMAEARFEAMVMPEIRQIADPVARARALRAALQTCGITEGKGAE